jgi:hypothetical protein
MAAVGSRAIAPSDALDYCIFGTHIHSASHPG